LRIGVTGHRILMEEEKIKAGIEKALDLLREHFGERPMLVLTSLAEGADRMVAEAVLRRPGSTLVAVTPFSLEEYVKDFGPGDSPSREEFHRLLGKASEVVELSGGPDRETGYAMAGEYVVDNCDALIAVWDGREAQGRGGTGEMVARARAQGKPVLVVRAGNRRPGTDEPTTLGDEQGRVVAEGLAAASPDDRG